MIHWLRRMARMVWPRRPAFRSLGERCVVSPRSSTYASPGNISLGDDVHIGPRCHLDGTGGIRIGRGTVIAPEVVIYSRTHNFDRDLRALPFDNVVLTAEVSVGDFAWIGRRAMVLPGVTIGEGAVIGAGAVVAGDVPACAVAVGNPARVVRYRDREVFDRLRAEPDPFVYTRLGHAKILKRKSDA